MNISENVIKTEIWQFALLLIRSMVSSMDEHPIFFQSGSCCRAEIIGSGEKRHEITNLDDVIDICAFLE